MIAAHLLAVLLAQAAPLDVPGVQVDPKTNVPIEAPLALDPTLPDVEPISGMDLEVSAGGVGAFTAGQDGALKPFARIRTATALPIFNGTKKGGGILPKWDPRLYIRADFTGLPGRTTSITDIATFNAIEVAFGLGQPVFQSRYQCLELYFEGGFATSLSSGSRQPMNRTQRWFGGGVMLRQKEGKAYIKLGVGGDQRLDSIYWYAPAILVSGSVRLWTEKAQGSAIKGVGVSFGGNASLGLGYGVVGVEPTRDLVQLWFGVSR